LFVKVKSEPFPVVIAIDYSQSGKGRKDWKTVETFYSDIPLAPLGHRGDALA